MLNKHKICHVTSAHSRISTRIFLKQCQSLAKSGYPVSLMVADGKRNEIRDEIAIYDVGASLGRVDRMINTPKRLFTKAVSLDADLYHLHDPELIPMGVKLKKIGKKVIFDSHEDVPTQFLGKPYLNKPLKRLISKMLGCYEAWACKQFNAIIAATPFIRDKFLSINPTTLDINNFPLREETNEASNCHSKRAEVCYVGSIGTARGIKEIVSAMSMVKSEVRLQLAGNFFETVVETEIKKHEGWSRVDAVGHLDRSAVLELMTRSVAGLVTLRPLPNYIDSQPIKMFEYMNASIPVIASNFPLWQEIIEGNKCGLCVDPMNPKAIAEAIDFFVTYPEQAKEMGTNGRRAIINRYNWPIEERKLLSFYEKILT